MPLYEYQCDACGKRFEVIQKFSDAVLEVCRLCGSGPVQRLISSPAIQFKGSGWYITDYSQKGKSEGSKSAEPSGAKTDAPKTGADSGAKTETKGAAPAATPAKPAE